MIPQEERHHLAFALRIVNPSPSREALAKGFEDAEASLRLEGLAISAFGQSIKARVLAGELTLDEAEDAVIAHYAAKAAE